MRSVFKQTFGLRGLGRAAGALPATALPFPGNLVTRFSAGSVAAADGAAVQTWTDMIGGVVADQATGGSRPTYVASGVGGKPGMRFPGQTAFMNIATPGTLRTTIDSGVYTVMIVAKRLAGTGGALFGAAATAGNKPLWLLDGTGVGRYSSGYVTYSGTEFITLGSSMTNAYSAYTGASGNYEQHYVNGAAVASVVGTSITTAAAPFLIGAMTSAALKSNADIYEILVWNRFFTPRDWLAAEKWARDYYGQPYAWASSEVRIFSGDSITAGIPYVTTAGLPDPRLTMPHLVAAAKGWPLGTWWNCGIGGQNIASMGTLAPDREDAIMALTGRPGVLHAMNWANPGIIQKLTPAQIYADLQSWISARRAAAPSLRVIAGTSTDYNQTTYPGASDRAAYNALWDAYWSGSHPLIEGYVATHASALIGTVGAVSANPTRFYSDGLHLSTTGLQEYASLVGAAWSALP